MSTEAGDVQGLGAGHSPQILPPHSDPRKNGLRRTITKNK